MLIRRFNESTDLSPKSILLEIDDLLLSMIDRNLISFIETEINDDGDEIIIIYKLSEKFITISDKETLIEYSEMLKELAQANSRGNFNFGLEKHSLIIYTEIPEKYQLVGKSVTININKNSIKYLMRLHIDNEGNSQITFHFARQDNSNKKIKIEELQEYKNILSKNRSTIIDMIKAETKRKFDINIEIDKGEYEIDRYRYLLFNLI
jgi:hypothetical protein